MNVILLGPPGAGKGTQAKRLQQHFRIPHVASGDLFRSLRLQENPLASKVQGYMDRGEYVPDDLTIQLVLDRLNQPDTRSGFLLDGFPRTERQAAALDTNLRDGGRKVDRALFINAPVDVLVKRLTGRIVCPNCHAIYNADTKPPLHDMACDICGSKLERRSDESPQVVRVRLDTYARQTEPVVNHYKALGSLVEIDGSRSMQDVEVQVDSALGVDVKTWV